MAINEHAKWREFLHPVVTGLVALMAAATLLISNYNKQEADAANVNMSTRQALTEQRVQALETNQSDMSVKMDKMLDILTDLRLDVATIVASKRSVNE